MSRRGATLIGVLAAVAILEYGAYFWNAGHFFQGDTIFWFDFRLRSPGEFFQSFVHADPGGWYRPLTNRTIQSLLYPFLGFEPAYYRWMQFLLFFLDSVVVLILALKTTGRLLASVLATAFFAVHTVNAYITYDLSFTPELVYTFFYLAGFLAFLRYLEAGRRVFLALSLLCYGLSLCSKEAAVTLPILLAAAGLLQRQSPRRVAWSLVPHAVLAVFYLWFTVGHLGVASEALASMRQRPNQFETGGYYFFVGSHVVSNALSAAAWALNLPVGMLGASRDATLMRNVILWGFAVLQVPLLGYAWRRGDRRALLLGLSLFWVAALPGLPLRGHFMAYYLLLPITGFAVVVGSSWDRLHEEISKRSPAAAHLVIALTFGLLMTVCVKSARSDARNNPLLGGSSAIAENSLKDLRAMYPVFEPGSTIFIDNDEQADLWFHHAEGRLFRLAYGDESLKFRYSTLTYAAPPATGGPEIFLAYRGGHLVNHFSK